MSRKRSVVWEFYVKIDNAVASCKVCNNNIRYHGSTGNLMDHIKRKHSGLLTLYSMTGSLETGVNSIQPTWSEEQKVLNVEIDGASTSSSGITAPPVTSQISEFIIFNKDAISGNQSNSSNQNTRKSIPLKTTPAFMKPRELPNNKIKEIDNLLIETVAVGYLPFDIVENKKFIQLFNVLEPRYKLPSREILTNKLINDRYLEIKNNISRRLNECKYVALTADMWTSINIEGFLSVTAHFIHSGELHAAVLATEQIGDCRTAESIALNVRSIMNDWKITNKTFALVTENINMMIAVAKILKLNHLCCAAYTLNSAVNDLIQSESLEVLLELRQKCRNLVDSFKTSTVGRSKLTECQQQLKKKPLKLKQELCSQWNSTYIMIERLLQLKEALIMTLSYVNCTDSLNSSDWTVLEDCHSLLEPLNELVEEMSTEKYSTSSIIIPLVRGCQNAVKFVNPITDTGKKLQIQLLEALSNKMTPYETTYGICAKATILDPRFKKYAFTTPQNATLTVDRLICEIDYNQSSNEDNTVASGAPDRVSEETDTEKEPDRKKRKSIWKFFIEQKDKLDAIENSNVRIEEDMRLYLSKPLIDVDKDNTNPIAYWMKNEESMPGLADAAYKYLCVPSSSVPSDRIFSKAGQLWCERRNRLKAKIVDKMVFLNLNEKFAS